VPVIVGDTKDEAAIFFAPDDAVWNDSLTEDELGRRVTAVAGDKQQLLAYYGRQSGRPADHRTHRFQLRRALDPAGGGKAARNKRRSGPTISTGKRRPSAAAQACHSVEVPFVFDTLNVIGQAHHKPGARHWRPLSRTGRPSPAPERPTGRPYTTAKRTTMVFDDECRTVDDPDGEVRPIWRRSRRPATSRRTRASGPLHEMSGPEVRGPAD